MSADPGPDRTALALRVALAARAGDETGPACAAAEEIWRASRGELPEERVRALLDHSLGCGACARAWSAAAAIGEECAREGSSPLFAFVQRQWAPLAGGLLLAAAGVLLWVRAPAADVRLRGASGVGAAEERALPRGQFLLRWAPQAPRARYSLTVATPDLQVLYGTAGLDRPEQLVPAAALEKVPEDGVVLVRIEALLPDGSRVPLGLQRVRVR